jgi:hypothetical protein
MWLTYIFLFQKELVILIFTILFLKGSLVVGLKANPFLGGTIKNHFKEWLRNQKLIK